MDAVPDAAGEVPGLEDDEDVIQVEEGTGAATGPPPAYVFDPADVSVAVAMVDAAFEGALDGFAAARAVVDAAAAHGVPADGSLVRELVLAASHRLQLQRGDRPGCELGSATGGSAAVWPPAIASVGGGVVQLWRALAEGATAPAAVARFEDLLFCRRDGNAGAHAARAVEAYLDAAERGDLDLDAVEAVLRAWTLARSARLEQLQARVRQKLASSADDVLTNSPGKRPGLVLPMLGALAAGPVNARRSGASDAIDVDHLLGRAADAFDRGYLATRIAGYRRSRTRDPAALETIAREEVAAYFRDAEASPVPAVRMHRLEQAARIARDRGLGNLARDAVAEMQRINLSDLGLMHITASSSLPRFVPEALLRPFTRSLDWRDAMEWFLAESPPTGDIERLKEHERQTRGGLGRWFPPVVLGADGLPRATASSAEEQAAHEMSFAAGITAEYLGRLMAEGLRRMAEHYGVPSEDDLVGMFTRKGAGDARLARSLAKAFRHFWNGDYESCVHLAAPKAEAAARSLLRELDEGIYRVQSGKDPGGYPGLYALLTELEKLALDESWAYFLRWLLLGPYGRNVRNDVAHGFISDISPTYAALTLRAVSVLVIMAGPPIDDHLGPNARRQDPAASTTRDRSTVLDLLTAPLGPPGPIDRPLGWAARHLDRAWWFLQTTRTRARLLRLRRSRTEPQIGLATQ